MRVNVKSFFVFLVSFFDPNRENAASAAVANVGYPGIACCNRLPSSELR